MSTADPVILNQLKPVINDLKAPISISKAIAKNSQIIAQLKDYGISNDYLAKTLSEASGTEIKLTTFKTILQRIKKQAKPRSRVASNPALEEKSPQNPRLTKTPQSEWNDIGVETARLIDDFIEAGLTPVEIKAWGCTNDMQRRKRLTELLVKRSKTS
jgi:hypothetical protein